MRAIQTKSIHFRAPGILAERLADNASARGMSVSEFLRSIAREKVGLN